MNDRLPPWQPHDCRVPCLCIRFGLLTRAGIASLLILDLRIQFRRGEKRSKREFRVSSTYRPGDSDPPACNGRTTSSIRLSRRRHAVCLFVLIWGAGVREERGITGQLDNRKGHEPVANLPWKAGPPIRYCVLLQMPPCGCCPMITGLCVPRLRESFSSLHHHLQHWHWPEMLA